MMHYKDTILLNYKNGDGEINFFVNVRHRLPLNPEKTLQ
jgi:hypothetical protein